MRMSRGRGGAALFASVVVAGAIAAAPAHAAAGKVLVFAGSGGTAPLSDATNTRGHGDPGDRRGG